MSRRTFGLTGGIASGKSTVLQYFDQLGIRTCDTDQLAREVIAPGSAGQLALSNAIGSNYFDQGLLDRAKLRELLFRQHPLRQTVESIIHPLVKKAADIWRRQPNFAPYQVLASPLLLETYNPDDLDGIIIVDVTPDTQLRRASDRDQQAVDAIQRIIRTQMDREERLSYADFILYNSGTTAALQRQIETLHGHLMDE